MKRRSSLEVMVSDGGWEVQITHNFLTGLYRTTFTRNGLTIEGYGRTIPQAVIDARKEFFDKNM